MSVVLAAVGDVLIDRIVPGSTFDELAPVFDAADIVFGNFEGVLTDNAQPLPGAATATIVKKSNADGLNKFTVLSLANNHSMDAGYVGISDTIDVLSRMEIKAIGAGLTPDDAWKPGIVSAKDRRIAFIAVTSICSVGHDARGQRGGVAALGTTEYYSPRFPGAYIPGIPPRTMTVVDEEDWGRLENAITFARREADTVVVSMHWGDHTRPYVITDFEKSTAQRLSQLHVDLILGHHQHYVRAVDRISNTLVCYGLGHIVFDHPRYDEELRLKGANWLHLSEPELEHRFGRYAHFPRKSGLPFHDLARWTFIAIVELFPDTMPKCGIVPAYIGMRGSPEPIKRSSAHFREFLEVIKQCAEEGYVSCRIRDDGADFAGLPLLAVTV